MTPVGVEVMVANGHTVRVEKNAGNGSEFEDSAYEIAGAEIVNTPQEIFNLSEMVMHVKEPLLQEYDLIKDTHSGGLRVIPNTHNRLKTLIKQVNS
ncbi:MAG: hypothetical protein JRJ20_08320 [Deltaproteobacteria bacterium]|nr:hypothetical protein [Deltaproteobacteria bacterium]